MGGTKYEDAHIVLRLHPIVYANSQPRPLSPRLQILHERFALESFRQKAG